MPEQTIREHRGDGIPYIIDNREGSVTLADALNLLLQRRIWADFATGYLSLSGYRMLRDGLYHLDDFRLLFGESRIGDEILRDLRSQRYSASSRALVEDLLQFLRQEGVQVKRYAGPFFHAKAYITDGTAIVGSSNFTHNGLTSNTELNAVHKEQPIVEEFSAWYTRMWHAPESEDYKGTLIDLLERSQLGGYPYTPYEVYIKALYTYFKDDLDSTPDIDPLRSIVELTAFQNEAFQKAQRILRRYHGVMVADAVGLGKTFVGKKLLELYAYYQRLRALIICPAQLQTMWEREIDESRIPARIVSMERLGQADLDVSRFADVEVIMVDESHNFRNAGTNRYNNLAKIVGSGDPKRVILLTATPISNTLWDLYHQLALFTRNNDGYFRDVGIPSLRRYFREAEAAGGAGGTLFNLLEEVVIRRTRSFIQDNYPEATINGQPLRFPTRHLDTIEYSLSETYSGLFDQIIAIIEQLHLPAYNAEGYKQQQTRAERRQENANTALMGLLKTNLLKRFESSVEAFRISIHRLRSFEERFLREFEQGRLLQSGAHRVLLQLEEDGDDLGLEQALERLQPVESAEYDLSRLRGDIQHDLATLDRVIALIEPITPVRDHKLEQFRAYLHELVGQKVIIFSYYRDTARYVWGQLRADPKLSAMRGTCLSSDVAPRERQRIIERFAPHSSRVSVDSAMEYDLLISTDVLSEGQNLQDAAHLINYDLHWNPTRMIQRAGRIDRLGSVHTTITISNIFPDQELEALLRLVERLQDRLRAINETISLDASVLGELIDERTFNTLRELAAGDDSSLKFWGQVSELAGNEMMRQQLLTYLREHGREMVDGLPDGIHSCLRRGQARGVFAYYRHKDRHFWRFWHTDGRYATDNRFEIHDLIRATPGEARDEEWLTTAEQEEALEAVAQAILTDVESRRGTALLGEQIDKVQRDVSTILKANWNKPDVDKPAAQAVYSVLRKPLPAPFVRQLRTLHVAYGSTGDFAALLDGLSAMVEAYALDQAAATALSPASETITREDLHLICWTMVR